MVQPLLFTVAMRKTIIVVAVLSTTSVAWADFVDHANPNVTEIRSDPSSGMRAILGSSGRTPYLTIERISGGRVSEQIEVEDVQLGDRVVALDSLRNLSLTRWSRGELVFEGSARKRDYQCRLSVGRVIKARCTDAAGGASDEPAAAAPAAAPSMAEIKLVTDACTSAFTYSGRAVKDRCIASGTSLLGGRHRTKVVDTIAGCKKTFLYSSDTEKQTCIDTAAKGSYDPLEVLKYCAENNVYEGDAKKQACIADFARK